MLWCSTQKDAAQKDDMQHRIVNATFIGNGTLNKVLDTVTKTDANAKLRHTDGTFKGVTHCFWHRSWVWIASALKHVIFVPLFFGGGVKTYDSEVIDLMLRLAPQLWERLVFWFSPVNYGLIWLLQTGDQTHKSDVLFAVDRLFWQEIQINSNIHGWLHCWLQCWLQCWLLCTYNKSEQDLALSHHPFNYGS